MTNETLDKIRNRIVSADISIISALKKMDVDGIKVLFVFESGKFVCILTIGDIQRGIIRNNALEDPIGLILDRDKVFARAGERISSIKRKMVRLRAECMPVLDDDGELDDVVFWEDIFADAKDISGEEISVPVVIMAGGKGTRLKPLTNVIPKPMIPLGDKTMLELIMDSFISIGSNRFYLSTGYKHDILEYYVRQLDPVYNIEFFREEKPLGTIGSISLLKGKINSTFFVSNCDILIEQDFREVYRYHKESHNELTVISAVKSINIPYGVIEIGENGMLKAMKEKPDMTYMINSGVYVLEPGLIDEIPYNGFYHVTDLIESVRKRGGKVGCFPVSEKSWTDIGDWKEYLKIIGK